MPSTDRRALGWLLLIALLAHLSYFALEHNFSAPDTRSYVMPADSLVHGRGYIGADGDYETRRTPVYPVVLALFQWASLEHFHVILVQHLLSVALVGLVYLAFRRMLQNRNIAFLAAVLLAIDLPTIHHANLLLTETLFTVNLFAVYYLAWRATDIALPEGRRTAIMAGVGLLIGLSVLIRPISIVFFVPTGLYLGVFAPGRNAARLALFTACALLLPSAWAWENARHTGVFSVSSISGDSTLLYKAAGALALEDSGDFVANFHRRQKELLEQANAHIQEVTGQPASSLPHARRSIYYNQIGRELVLEHFGSAVTISLKGMAVTLLGGGADALTRITGLSIQKATWLLLCYTGLCLPLALFGAGLLLRQNRNLGFWTVLTLLYFVGISAGAESYSRFRVPVLPMYTLCIAYGVFGLKEAWGRRSGAVAAKSDRDDAP